jgi:hypothetical protein
VPKYYAVLFLCHLFTLMISQWDIVTDEDPVYINNDDVHTFNLLQEKG